MKVVSELCSATAFVVVEAFLELRNIALEVFFETLSAIVAAMYK